MDWTALWLLVQPHLTEIVIITFGAILSWVGALGAAVLRRIGQSVGLQIEEKHRAALHQAILTGVNQALAKQMDSKDAASAAVDHALLSVPDAIGALTKGVKAKTKAERQKAVREVLLRIALGKLGMAGKLLSGG